MSGVVIVSEAAEGRFAARRRQMRCAVSKRITNGIELLADPTRRRIVALIAGGTRRPAAIAGEIGLSRPATSRQLRLLLQAGLLRWTFDRFDLRGRFYIIEPAMQGPIIAWLAGTEVGRQPTWRHGWWSAPVDVPGRALWKTDSGPDE